ncbi:FimV/HubP family polar landmark protein [Snodgrassella alvi]|uniref:FimV/HubP family polar landmark protein n=1 Tax=Snodgrassella alvi TaxID=1196083 RepID=UPI001557973E|nr:FimV/HubP family polar landmark protein [Snodgrassella alvi]
MKNANNLKIIALSLCMLASAPAWAGLGSLQVNSALGEPFSGSIVVTGDEAKAALHGRPAVSGAPLQVRVTAQGQNAVIHLRSSKPVHDPMLTFSLAAGSQGRQYTALLDPPERHHSAGKNKATGKHPKSVHSAPVRSAREKSAARATVALQNGLASENAVVKYNVDNNETLMDVARKVRPQGLSLEHTMHAIQVANPNAFRNGNPDLMYRNISLNIPSTSQLKKLSKVPLKTAVKPEVTQNTTPAVTKEKDNPKVAANTRDTAASEAQTKENTVKAETSAASSVPAQASATIQASEVAQASAPAASAASVVKAVPVQPKVNTQPVQPAEEPAEESMLPSWWPYALAGLAGVLLIAALLWQRSRKRNSIEYSTEYDEDYSDDEDDDVVFETEPSVVTQSTSTSVPATTAKTAAAATAVTTTANTAADDDDWSWLNDAAASDQPVQADNKSAPAKEVHSEPVSQVPDKKVTEAKQEEDDTDWLNFNFTDDTPATSADTAAPSSAELDSNDDLSWLDQIDATEQPEVLTSHEQPAVTEPQQEVADNTDFEWVVAEEQHPDESQAEAHQDFVLQDNASSDSNDLQPSDISFSSDLDAVQPEQQSKPAAAEDDSLNSLADLQWDEDFKFDDESKQDTSALEEVHSSIEQTLAPHDQHAFAAEDDAISTDIDWDSLGVSDDSDNQPIVVPEADTEEIDIPSMDFALEDDNSKPAPAVNATAAPTRPTSSFATGDGGQDWLEQSAKPEQVDKPLTPEQQAIPLQAKLELAKMYLEMDDAVTARQTLRELVDEANGAILAEAQNLLQQLGG